MDPAQLNKGILFDVQGYSVHDGPGCRTLIFLKGCPLRCSWCSNPEGINPFPEPMWNQELCIHDGFCIGACDRRALQTGADGLLMISRMTCKDCTTYDCKEACLTGALNVAGSVMTVQRVLEIVRRDRRFWGSGGGITLTGGEPFLQPDFTRAILEACYREGIHTAVETCGCYPVHSIRPSLPFLDWIFFDLKIHDPDAVDPQVKLIRETALYLAGHYPGRLIYRLPLISHYTDSMTNLVAIREFILSTGRLELNILPGHHLGREKWRKIGRNYYTTAYESVTTEAAERTASIFRDAGIACWVAGETPF